MNPEYVDAFAPAYDRFWAAYPRRMAEAWLAFHTAVAPSTARTLLDVGCGTGIVAERFVAAGYRVVGLDISGAMLARARERLGPQVPLLCADAADFTLEQTVAFALSTYDIPNHLGRLDRVRGYLRSVHRAVEPGGWLGFDLCTLRGLRADLGPGHGGRRDDLGRGPPRPDGAGRPPAAAHQRYRGRRAVHHHHLQRGLSGRRRTGSAGRDRMVPGVPGDAGRPAHAGGRPGGPRPGGHRRAPHLRSIPLNSDRSPVTASTARHGVSWRGGFRRRGRRRS